LVRHVKLADLNGDGHLSLEENWIQTMMENFRISTCVEPRDERFNTIEEGNHTWNFHFDKEYGLFEARYSNGTWWSSYIFYNPENITLYLGDATVEELCGPVYNRNDLWMEYVIQNIFSHLEKQLK